MTCGAHTLSHPSTADEVLVETYTVHCLIHELKGCSGLGSCGSRAIHVDTQLIGETELQVLKHWAWEILSAGELWSLVFHVFHTVAMASGSNKTGTGVMATKPKWAPIREDLVSVVCRELISCGLWFCGGERGRGCLAGQPCTTLLCEGI